MLKPTDLAVIDCLWIGEKKPDFFSWCIQRFLSWYTSRDVNFSHNAFVFRYTGRMYHATTPGGVTDCTPMVGLKGCHVRARKVITLEVTNEFFHGWLMGERGKSYAHRQNVFGVMSSIFPALRRCYKDGDRQRNCSEFLAAALQFSSYRVSRGDRDYLLPTDTANILKPEFYK